MKAHFETQFENLTWDITKLDHCAVGGTAVTIRKANLDGTWDNAPRWGPDLS